MPYTREGFKIVIRRWFPNNPGMVDDDSPVWCPEHDMTDKCEWFVCVPCLSLSRNNIKDDYWLWCTNNLNGYVRCFMSDSDNNKEWWGFTDGSDITVWLLKWAR